MVSQITKQVFMANNIELAEEVNTIIRSGYNISFILQTSPFTCPKMDGIFKCNWLIFYSN